MARPMEFWGVEVKAGQPLKVNPGDSRILHLSQATLGESKNIKANDSVPVFVNFGGKKLVLGTLSPEKFPQLAFDLVFEKEFELSHSWKSGSVFFCGYTTIVQEEEDDISDDDSDEEDLSLNAENGKGGSETSAKATTAAAKPSTASDKPESSTKPKVTIVEPMKVDEEDSDEDDEDEEGSDDSEADSDEEDSDEEEATKKAAEQGKKRPAESAPKTPVSDKKAKVTTPQKTDGKKGGHAATPHPAKQAAKASANAKQQTPKSDAKVSCESCNKSFNSENALQAHSKAKHGAK